MVLEAHEVVKAAQSVDRRSSAIFTLTIVGVVLGGLGTTATWLILLFER
jgi:hypothetical protein